MGDDEELVASAQAGDRDALETLLKDHYDRLYAVCRRMTGNDADASDATQDALIAIARGLARFDARARFTTWSHRVAVNACLDELRRRRRRPEPVEDVGAHADPAPDPADAAARLDVDAALRRVPADFRAAVVLRDLCGLDYAEVAEVLEVPIGTVRSRIARGRAAVAEELTRNSPPTGGRPTDYR